ncbi:hypothetical protein DYB35_003975, partial [Aphanomyces astaci]
QGDVYTKTVRNIIPTILKGFNATIFAYVLGILSLITTSHICRYGATGAGKTHTMMGSERDGSGDDNQLGHHDDDDDDDNVPHVDGIIPHALTDIFRLINSARADEEDASVAEGLGFQWSVVVTYLEVYNEQIRDLLNPSSRPLALREDPAASVVSVKSVTVLWTDKRHGLCSGNRNRRTEATAANQVSSRSHAVLQVTVKHMTTTMFRHNNPHEATTEGVLSLIDLAGSERASNTQNTGLRLTEGANINKSLLALANCINALSSSMKERRRSDSSVTLRVREKPAPRTKYRDSKLTHLLKVHSLEGDCRLVMIANINPSHACFEETHNTLKYANRAKNIRIRPKKHVVTAEMTHIQRADRLEQENAALRQALLDARGGGGVKRKSVDADMLNDLQLDMDAKRAKHHESVSLQRTIDQLTREKRQLQARVADLEAENRQLKQLQNGPRRVSVATTSQLHRSAVHPVAYPKSSRQSLIPRFNPQRP